MKKMKKQMLVICLGLLLCAALALPALAYPAGIDESLPRVVDDAGLLDEAEIAALDSYAREIIAQHEMDLVIVTQSGIGGQDPIDFADDYFDYMGYGWREEESEDTTEGSGLILLLNMVGPGNNDAVAATKGEGMLVFREGIWEAMVDAVAPELIDQEYYAALEHFLREAESYLLDYVNGAGVYENWEGGINDGYYGDDGYYYNQDGSRYDDYDYTPEPSFNMTVFLIALVAGLLIAWMVVAGMKRRHNTIRIAQAARDYQQGFTLTENQNVFLYSNTNRVRIQTDTHTGSGGGRSGGGYSGGGSRVSSSGSTHGGGGRKF